MADLFKNKYRIKSARLESWDYRWNAAYFITICTANRKHYFGEIKNGKMEFSPTGVIADILWHEIPHHTSYVHLDNFVVMPNHIHGILILNNPEIPKENISKENIEEGRIGDRLDPKNDSRGNHLNDPVQTLRATSQEHPQKHSQMAKISPKSNSISTIIRSYKSATTKHAHRLEFDFEWQTRFYDIIIRNEISFQNISNYIKNNPAKWKEDKFH
ncbi:transposase [Salinimicrobium sp. MT39]|uniref:Transposase n=1 Tax=Salinimicrobium profundisediminis TaxID=2994553 RepID=A0A9X3CUK2_9FLAO|nr:transposase [Salinimicrobium profundisediminis]MCX2836860.1 transposase [Salinimicrobium profundisediminis]